jgi:hypothetical protein
MRQVNNETLLTCFLLTALLGACAYNSPIPYRSFERIEIITLDSETPVGSIPSRGESAVTGAVAGAFGGLTASFFASLACGPYFALCFGASAPLTIGATALVGGAIGVSGISDEDAAKIISYLEAMQATHDLNQELAMALAEKLPSSSLVPPGVADARISLDVNSLRLVKGIGDKTMISMTIVTRYEWSLNEPSPPRSSRTFRCETRSRSIPGWANDGGATIEQELNYCIEDLAHQVNKVLTDQPPTPVDLFPDIGK